MNIEAQKRLDRIFIKSIPELSDEEISFLRARQSYLSDEQLKLYKSILSNEVVKENTELSYKELQTEASILGMRNVVGKSKKILIEFIKNNNN